MSDKHISDLAFLCWVNPFSLKRGELEQRLLGEAFRPISQTGGRGIFSPNLDVLLMKCRELLTQGPVHPESAELAAFVIYHELANDIDGLISEPKQTRRIWKKYLACWEQYYPGYASQPQAFDQATLFALFYQIRRAFNWIYNYVIGSSPDASRLRERIWESIFSHDLKRYVSGFHREMNDIHSLITGPSGSGKGLVARAIGMSRFIPFDPDAQRFAIDPEAAFFSVNVAVLPEQLLESVLFGHAKGAFTGAVSDHVGLFESTGPNGVLFLDEIGEASGAAQAKLLTVLQDRRFQRVGETHSRIAQGRMVTATNRNLEEAVASGQFREDLYFRLSADRLETVPLRTLTGGKTEALEPMVSHITRKLLGESWTTEVVGDSLQFIDQRLGADYPWPGNFRELEQCLRNFLIHQDYKPVSFAAPRANVLEKVLMDKRPTAEALLRQYAGFLYNQTRSYKRVGEIMDLDQRTAKRYVDAPARA